MHAAVTIHLPPELLDAVDALGIGRDAFIEQAVRRQLAMRARGPLRASLENPHPESRELSDVGLADWAASLPEGDAAEMCDPGAGTPVRWIEGSGFQEEAR